MTKLNIGLAAAAAAMVALAPSVARAQDNSVNTTTTDNSTTTTTTTTTTEFVPINIPTIAPPPMGPNGEPIDYTVLAGKRYTYTDLAQARAEGFSWHDIAVIAKISDKSGMPFEYIKHLALEGESFPTIAFRFNLSLVDVLHARDYEIQVAEYRDAYRTTGSYEVHELVEASREEMVNTPGRYNYMSDNGGPNADLAGLVSSRPELSMFNRALRRARLMKILNGPGPLTIFAPTDAAFAKLSNDQINAMMRDRSQLVKILDYDIIPQSISAAQAMAMTSPTSPATLEGDPLQVTTSNGTVMVNGATVTTADLDASNGVLHEIDTVILPPSVMTVTTTTTTTTNNTVVTPPAPAAPTPAAPAPAQ